MTDQPTLSTEVNEEPSKKEEETKHEEEDDTSSTVTRDELLRKSISFESSLFGKVSFDSSPETRWQTIAMFSCSLYFIGPCSLLCWAYVVYGLARVPLTTSTHGSPWSILFTTLLVGYLTFCWVLDKSHISGSRTPWMRGGIFTNWWKNSCDYLPLLLVKTADLPAFDKDKKPYKYVLGYHPHGIISVGCFGAFATDGAQTLDLSTTTDTTTTTAGTTTTTTDTTTTTTEQRGFSSLFPGIDRRVITLPQNFMTPFLREYFLSMGACSSPKETFRRVLAKNNPQALVVVVGGAAESLEGVPGTINLVLSTRRGFVREAIMAHASLVPVMAFGENDLYEVYHAHETEEWVGKFQYYFKQLTGVAMPLFVGRSILFRDFGVMPHRKPVVVVVGAPLAPPTTLPPLEEEDKDKSTTPAAPRDWKSFQPLIDRATDTPLNADGKLLMEHHAKYIEALQLLHKTYRHAPWNAPSKHARQSMYIVK